MSAIEQQIVKLTVLRANSTSPRVRNNLTRQIERLARAHARNGNNGNKPQQQTRTRKAPTKAKQENSWRDNKPSDSQIARINAAEEAILAHGKRKGIALIERHNNKFDNSGHASDYYRTLSAYCNEKGLHFSRAA